MLTFGAGARRDRDAHRIGALQIALLQRMQEGPVLSIS